jgi:hypothetical protein
MIHEHATELAGLPVEDYDPERGVTDPAGTAYRLRLDWEDYDWGKDIERLMRRFLADPRAREVRGVVLGCWSYESTAGADEAVRLLAEAGLPELRAVFVGDIVGEEHEASWIIQTDHSPLLAASPKLEYLRTRGNEGLSFGKLRHGRFKALIVETGGLSVDVVRQVCDSDLAELEHLELWLGTENYGWTGGVEDLQPILSGRLFPKLRYLGLRDSEIAGELAAVVANAPVIRRIEILDLSLGPMGTTGSVPCSRCPPTAGSRNSTCTTTSRRRRRPAGSGRRCRSAST